jgi:hypothetical protein
MSVSINNQDFIWLRPPHWLDSPIISGMCFRTTFFEKLDSTVSVSKNLTAVFDYAAAHSAGGPASYPVTFILLDGLATHLDGVVLGPTTQPFYAFFPSPGSPSANSSAIKLLQRFQLRMRLLDVLIFIIFPHLRVVLDLLSVGQLVTTPKYSGQASEVYGRAEWIIAKVADSGVGVDDLIKQMVCI